MKLVFVSIVCKAVIKVNVAVMYKAAATDLNSHELLHPDDVADTLACSQQSNSFGSSCLPSHCRFFSDSAC